MSEFDGLETEDLFSRAFSRQDYQNSNFTLEDSFTQYSTQLMYFMTVAFISFLMQFDGESMSALFYRACKLANTDIEEHAHPIPKVRQVLSKKQNRPLQLVSSFTLHLANLWDWICKLFFMEQYFWNRQYDSTWLFSDPRWRAWH